MKQQHIDERFLRDVRDHKLTILQDDGVHRHLRLARPGSSAYHFNVVTFPGYIVLTGDMGSWTFARVQDMFTFFRDESMRGAINPSYWHEKAEAVDKTCVAKEYSPTKFKQAVHRATRDWDCTLGTAAELQKEIREAFSGYDEPTDERDAYERIRDFQSDCGQHFEDFEYDLKEWSMHYLWACKAIVWAIKQYDLVKQERTQADHDARVLRGEL